MKDLSSLEWVSVWRDGPRKIKLIKAMNYHLSVPHSGCRKCGASAILMPFHIWIGDGKIGIPNFNFWICLSCDFVAPASEVNVRAVEALKQPRRSISLAGSATYNKVASLTKDGRIVSVLTDLLVGNPQNGFIIRNCPAIMNVSSGQFNFDSNILIERNNDIESLLDLKNESIFKIGLSSEYGSGSHPRSLKVELTQFCNLKCTFCTNPSLSLRAHLDFRAFLSIWRKIEPTELVKIGFTGLGETMVNKDFWRIHKLVKSYSIYTTMVTNGMLLDKFTPQILDSRLNDIAVSMETVDKRKFESTRVGADLKSVMTAIINFSRLAKGLETAPKINVICAADLQDLTAIEGVVRFCSEHDLSAPKIYPLYVRFTGSGLTESIEVKDFERVKDILDRYYPSRTVPICREHRLTMLKAQGAVAYNEVVCREPWSTAVLRADGTFSRCNESIFEVENGSAVPGLVSSSLRTLWHSDEYFSIRLGLWHKVPPTGCIGCNAYELVKGISV